MSESNHLALKPSRSTPHNSSTLNNDTSQTLPRVTFLRIGVSPQNRSCVTHTPSTCSSVCHFGHSSSSQSRTWKRRQSQPKLCAAPQISRLHDCVGRHGDLDDFIPVVSSFEEKPNGESHWHLLLWTVADPHWILQRQVISETLHPRLVLCALILPLPWQFRLHSIVTWKP